MGLVINELVLALALPPPRIFKAIVFDLDHLVIELMPQVVESVVYLEGHGGVVGSIKQINLRQDQLSIKGFKEKIEAIDEKELFYSYLMLDTDLEGVENMRIDVTFAANPDGNGTIMTRKCHLYTKGDNKIDEDEVKAINEKAVGLFRLIEAHLQANPDA